MAYLSGFMLSEDVTTGLDGKNNLFGIINNIQVSFVPTYYTLSMSIALTDYDENADKIITVVLKNSREEAVIDASLELDKIPKNNLADISPSGPTGFVINLNLNNIEIKYEGLYQVDIRLDGNLLGKFYFHIKKKEE